MRATLFGLAVLALTGCHEWKARHIADARLTVETPFELKKDAKKSGPGVGLWMTQSGDTLYGVASADLPKGLTGTQLDLVQGKAVEGALAATGQEGLDLSQLEKNRVELGDLVGVEQAGKVSLKKGHEEGYLGFRVFTTQEPRLVLVLGVAPTSRQADVQRVLGSLQLDP